MMKKCYGSIDDERRSVMGVLMMKKCYGSIDDEEVLWEY